MTRFVLPELDDTWRARPLGELAEIKYGSALTASSRTSTGKIPVYGSGGVVGVHDQPLHTSASIVIGRKGSVGSIFLTNGPFWCIDTAYYLDEVDEAVNLEYLSAYLQSIDLSRLAISVAIPGLNRRELALVPVPLPTLLEQERIVNALRHGEALRAAKQRTMKLCDDLASALFEQHFGVAGATSQWSMEAFGKHTTYSKYGPRFPDQPYSETGIHVLRTTDMNADGTIRWWEAPKLALSEKQIREHALKPGTLVISRSGTIGPFALFDGPEDQCVAGAYLIEFGLVDSIEPEYVRALFSTPYLQQMLRKAVRSVAQPNINAPNIMAIQIPVPPRDRQQVFSKHVRELREWTQQVIASAKALASFSQAVVGEAFSGDLTSQWRLKHSGEIAKAASARDTLLRERGAKLTLSTNIVSTPAAQADLTVCSGRLWLLDELSEFQRQVLAGFSAYCQASGEALLVEDPDVFARFCEDAAVTERLQAGASQGNRIRRSLGQLAALGLIAKVTLPNARSESGELEYLKAFRPFRSEEFTRLADVELVRGLLSATDDQSPFHFQVQLDYEASERAGAAGMFQVISVQEPDGADFTHLVDSGQHYASLDELKGHLATALKVAALRIELEEV